MVRRGKISVKKSLKLYKIYIFKEPIFPTQAVIALMTLDIFI